MNALLFLKTKYIEKYDHFQWKLLRLKTPPEFFPSYAPASFPSLLCHNCLPLLPDNFQIAYPPMAACLSQWTDLDVDLVGFGVPSVDALSIRHRRNRSC